MIIANKYHIFINYVHNSNFIKFMIILFDITIVNLINLIFETNKSINFC